MTTEYSVSHNKTGPEEDLFFERFCFCEWHSTDVHVDLYLAKDRVPYQVAHSGNWPLSNMIGRRLGNCPMLVINASSQAFRLLE
jgi:hypothetical protein